jgi:hypothetical protein
MHGCPCNRMDRVANSILPQFYGMEPFVIDRHLQCRKFAMEIECRHAQRMPLQKLFEECHLSLQAMLELKSKLKSVMQPVGPLFLHAGILREQSHD